MDTPCAHCGQPMSDRVRTRARFCSLNCKELARTAARRAVAQASRADRACASCGVLLPADKFGKAITCSKECSVRWQNRKRADAKMKIVRERRTPCERCGGLIPDGRRGNAKFCSPECKHLAMSARWREKAPWYQRLYKYGVTKEIYAELMERQDGRCAICRSDSWPGKDNAPHVDHDHVTGAVRGLLCGPCNTGLGQFKDDPALLRAAANYLEVPTS